MGNYEWLTVAAIVSTIFAFMMIWIFTRRAQIRLNNARKSRMAKIRKSTQRGGLNRKKVL